jgi:hypothetical protein
VEGDQDGDSERQTAKIPHVSVYCPMLWQASGFGPWRAPRHSAAVLHRLARSRKQGRRLGEIGARSRIAPIGSAPRVPVDNLSPPRGRAVGAWLPRSSAGKCLSRAILDASGNLRFATYCDTEVGCRRAWRRYRAIDAMARATCRHLPRTDPKL